MSEPRTEMHREHDVDRLIEAEHLWCVKVDGNFAFGHEPEAHHQQAEFIAAHLAANAPEPPVSAGLDWHQIADDIEGAAHEALLTHPVSARRFWKEVARIRDAAISAVTR